MGVRWLVARRADDLSTAQVDGEHVGDVAMAAREIEGFLEVVVHGEEELEVRTSVAQAFLLLVVVLAAALADDQDGGRFVATLDLRVLELLEDRLDDVVLEDPAAAADHDAVDFRSPLHVANLVLLAFERHFTVEVDAVVEVVDEVLGDKKHGELLLVLGDGLALRTLQSSN